MKILALNKSFIPIRLSTVYSVIGKFYCNAVEGFFIEGDSFIPKSWDEWLELSKKDIWPENTQFINSVTQRVAIPKVIRYLNYDKIPKVTLRLSRKSLYERDNYICYICGKKFSESKLSIDHVIPASRGGRSTWENMSTCCKQCNWNKGDKLLSELNIRPKGKMPFKPVLSNAQKLRASVTNYQKEWKLFGF